MQYSPHNYIITISYHNIKDTFFSQNVTSCENILSGQRFLLGIHAEIETDPNVKHAIIIDLDIIPPLEGYYSQAERLFPERLSKHDTQEHAFPKNR